MNKRGFSILEVVIAMAVIAIVSATALSIAMSSSDNTNAAMRKADAQYLAYDALECFKASKDAREFYNAFSKCRGTEENERLICVTNGELLLSGFDEVYLTPEGDFYIFLYVSYENPSKFSIIIQDMKNNIVAQILNYQKLN